MADVLAAMLAALEEKPEPLKSSDGNHPFKSVPTRAERRGQRPSHRDPTGDRAIGRIRKKEKKS